MRNGTRAGISVLHPTGNENVRHALKALDSGSLLSEFVTTVAYTADATASPFVPRSMQSLRSKRTFDLDSAKFTLRRRDEVLRNLLLKSRQRHLVSAAAPWGRFGVYRVARRLDSWYARQLNSRLSLSGVLGYHGMCVATLTAARSRGLATYLELAHANWPATLRAYQELVERHPAWAPGLSYPGSNASDQVSEELYLADVVFSPSRQVTESIIETHPSSLVVQASYGCPEVDRLAAERTWDGKTPLRVLFVGRLQASKGLPELADLKSKLGPLIDISIVGALPTVVVPPLKQLLESSNYLGTQPREKVLSLMREHQLFILPSVIEGRSLAALEALSSGLPMLVTPGSGVDDLVEQGAGAVVPVGDSAAIQATVLRYFENPERIQLDSRAAFRIARENSWSRYREDLLAGVLG